MNEATRLYLGECPHCGGICLFTCLWEAGQREMFTVIDCLECKQMTRRSATVDAVNTHGPYTFTQCGTLIPPE